MTQITKYIHHQGDINDIVQRYSAFEAFNNSTIQQLDKFKWIHQATGKEHYHVLISFFGKSGYGKSSTVNAFLGQDILKTSDVEACTRRCDCLNFQILSDYYLSFADYPGIGESEYRDKEYLKMYQDFLVYSNIVVYVLRADMRDYSIDELAYSTIFAKDSDKQKVIFAVNCCDKVEPIHRAWRESYPSPEQMINIDQKIATLNTIFKPKNKIIPYSANTSWGLANLAKEIVNVAKKTEYIQFW